VPIGQSSTRFGGNAKEAIDMTDLRNGKEYSRAEALRLGAGLAAAGGVLGPLAAAASASTRGRVQSTAAQRGGTIQVASAALFPKDTLDPVKMINFGEQMAGGTLYEGLVTYDFNYVPTPQLAESWEHNKTFTQWTFHLRKGVKYHDGQAFTANDVAWTLKRLLDPKSGSSINARLLTTMTPSSIKIVDDHTIQLNLKAPDSDLLQPLGVYGAYILPADTTDFKGIGTGPFKLKVWQPGTAWSVVRNPDYWMKGAPLLDGVDVVSIPEPSTKAQAVIAGQSDVTDIDYDLVPLIKGATSSINIQVAKAVELFNVTMDPTAKPFTDNRVRMAMKVGLDRPRLIKVAYAGYGTMAIDSPTPVNDKLFFPSSLAARMRPDKKASLKLLNEAGYPKGLDLTLITSSEPPLAKFSLAFADALQGSGFTINVVNHPDATYWDQIWMHNKFCVSDWTRRNPIEAMSVMLASNASENEAKFHSKTLDGLLAKSLRVGGTQQQQTVKKALTLVADNSGEVIPAYRDFIWVSKKRVSGLTFNPNALIDFRKVSIA
jgi:peptide/nickel transport system substrate-binding protein